MLTSKNDFGADRYKFNRPSLCVAHTRMRHIGINVYQMHVRRPSGARSDEDRVDRVGRVMTVKPQHGPVRRRKHLDG